VGLPRESSISRARMSSIATSSFMLTGMKYPPFK
jgi:hypothetical protein